MRLRDICTSYLVATYLPLLCLPLPFIITKCKPSALPFPLSTYPLMRCQPLHRLHCSLQCPASWPTCQEASPTCAPALAPRTAGLPHLSLHLPRWASFPQQPSACPCPAPPASLGFTLRLANFAGISTASTCTTQQSGILCLVHFVPPAVFGAIL